MTRRSLPLGRLVAFALLANVPAAFLSGQPSRAAGLGVTSPEQFSTADGFTVDLVHEVPAETQGSWVSLTVDPQGRLIACDQYGGLFRIDVSGPEVEVEPLEIDLAGAQGLLHAFGSLYANVNAGGQPCGVWRLTDTNGDDQYDKKEHILPLNGGSEHGPHAMILTPDGERIVMCAGNNTNLPSDIARSRVPQIWDEDHLLGRLPDARGHNAERMAPGGFVLSMDPDGSDVELIATGFRNHYDIAFNREGELFTYDADMEWDVGTPWYRPTRINHVISGAEFGWRNGTGKWPAYYPDSFGAAVNIGPGSPTGIAFGYGAKFPAKYKNALFIADWSYGNLYAVHLTPDGSSYSGTYETFATAAPLPITDLVIHPDDGAMYFTVGGRRTQSGLYRIRYTGDLDSGELAADETSKAEDAEGADQEAQQLRELRQQIEASHVQEPEGAIDLAVKHLGHSDRTIRFASRIALEQRPLDQWRDRVLSLQDPQARILGIVAIARHGEPSDRDAAFDALTEIDWSELSPAQQIDWLRAVGLVAMRLNDPTAEQRQAILTHIRPAFPTGHNEVDRELAQVLVYLKVPKAVDKILNVLEQAPSQEDQLHYLMALRVAEKGWNLDRYRRYFAAFNALQSARGGMSFGGFLENIKASALERVPEKIQDELAEIIHPPQESESDPESESRPFVKEWTVDELDEVVAESDRQFDFERGREMFAVAQCYKCHRMGVQGGILGPDLTGAGGRFNPHDLLESIIEPNKAISDQYGATQFLTDDGRVVVGRVVNMSGNRLSVMTNMLDPSELTAVDRDSILETQPAPTSMMPDGLLDTLSKDEIADLVAYLRAGGNADHPIYEQAVAAGE